jgi:hypothetical protein
VGLTCHTAARLSVGAGERSWVVNAGDSWRACFLVKDKLRGPVDSPMAERFVGDGSHFFCSSFSFLFEVARHLFPCPCFES